MEDGIMRELIMGSEESNEHGLPPGFRFHPTDEELISFYLASKVFHGTALSFPDVDLNRCEPWELPEVAKMGEREWYFFSLRDRKYPTGLRTNRATGAGYWKATGKDREVYAGGAHLLGLKKTLVFYKGRAPRGLKTNWVMHEYRLLAHAHAHAHACKEEWVMCRIYHKAVGDKTKFPLLLQERGIGIGHSNNMDAADLPPLLENEAQTTLLSFQEPYPSTESMFFKSLLSHQPADSLWDLLKGQSSSSNNTTSTSHVLKQCKTEAADSSSTMHHWVDPYQNQSLLFHNNNNIINVHDSSSPIFVFPPTSDHHDHYLSSSFAFNKTPPCFPINIATLLDP